MPWRRRPRAAFVFLLSLGALIAVATGLRPGRPAGHLLDTTLTRDAAGCAGVSTRVWHPLSGIDYTGRLRVVLPARFGGAIAFYIGDSLPLDIEATADGDQPAVMNHERLIVGPGVLLPADFWLEDGAPLLAPRHVSRLTIDASSERERVVLLSLGRRAPRVLARLVNYPAAVRAAVCADPVAADEIYFATGWYGQESEPGVGAVRWMREHGAVLVRSADGHDARVRVRVAPAAVDEGAVELRVRVNDMHDLAPLPLAARFQEFDLAVPDAAWTAGTNELLFSVSRTRKVGTRVRGLALASLHVH